MLKHLNLNNCKPSRVVILGSGFIGKSISNNLKSSDILVKEIRSKDLNLLSQNAEEKLLNSLHEDDVLVFISARAPCKDLIMLQENIKMAGVVCNVLKCKKISHLIYISSDAVYKDSSNFINEESCAEPDSIHGTMHLTREIFLKNTFNGPFTILRPTLVYGLDDPHNGYGPNRFLKHAKNNIDIDLFGNGEELRDHIFVDDIAELVRLIVINKSTGILNAVSGDVVSFKDIASFIVKKTNSSSIIRSNIRSGSMPHNGYRAFNAKNIADSFPDFKITAWRIGLNKIIELL